MTESLAVVIPPVAVTDSDRTRISDIIDQLPIAVEPKTHSSPDGPTALRARQLRTEGEVGAVVALERLRGRLDSTQANQTILALSMCATQTTLPRIYRHLLSSPQPRGTSSRELACILARIANPDGQLIEFVGRYVDRRVEASPRQMTEDTKTRVQLTARVVWAAMQRATPAERSRFEPIIRRWETLRDADGQPVLGDEWESSKNKLHPDWLAYQYASRFFTNTEDPEYGESLRAVDDIDDTSVTVRERHLSVLRLFNLLGQQSPGLVPDSIDQTVEELGREEDRLAAKAREYAQRSEELIDPPDVVIRLGTEIEVESKTIIHESDESPDTRAERIFGFLRLCRLVEGAGVPARPDVIWEHGALPAYNRRILSLETRALIALRAVDPSLSPPLHFNIGGIVRRGPGGVGANVLALSLAATGWCCTGARLVRPVRTGRLGWAKADGGILQRFVGESVLGPEKDVVELRPFCLENAEELDMTIDGLYTLGTALAAYQRQESGKPCSPRDVQLARIWVEYSAHVGAIFESNQIPDPSKGFWDNVVIPNAEGTINQNFVKLAGSLREASTGRGPGHLFREQMRLLVAAATNRIMPLLQPS